MHSNFSSCSSHLYESEDQKITSHLQVAAPQHGAAHSPFRRIFLLESQYRYKLAAGPDMLVQGTWIYSYSDLH